MALDLFGFVDAVSSGLNNSTAQIFLQDRLDRMIGREEEFNRAGSEILIELKFSCRAAAGQVNEALPAHLCAVGDGSQDIFTLQLRILFQ